MTDTVSIERERLRRLREYLTIVEPTAQRATDFPHEGRAWQLAMDLLNAMISRVREAKAPCKYHCHQFRGGWCFTDECPKYTSETPTPPPLVIGGDVVDGGLKPPAQTVTPAPEYDPATVAFPQYATQEALAQLDADHVALLKCYVHHLRDHMPAALRDAGEKPVEEPHVTQEQMQAAIEKHDPCRIGHDNKVRFYLSPDGVREIAKAAATEAITDHLVQKHATVIHATKEPQT
jgi:hypothetical protein